MKRPKYHPGSVIGVPLGDGKVGMALLARCSRRKRLGERCVLFYDFESVLDQMPGERDVIGLSPTDSVLLAFGTDHSTQTGRWPVVGALPEYHEERWPLPPMRSPWSRGSPHLWAGNDLDHTVRIGPEIVAPEDHSEYPLDLGSGDAVFLERDLRHALESHPNLYFRVSDARLERWRRAIEAVRKAFPGEVIQ